MPRFAVLVIDMLNPYEHDDGDALAEQARGSIEPLRTLIDIGGSGDSTLVYVNDNFDDFTANSEDLKRMALEGRHPDVIEPILPPEHALFVEKVRHSGFYESSLNHLLHIKDVETVVLAGQVTEQCILYTALDAYIRGFDLRVARDACVSLDGDLGDAAMKMMERNMSADIVSAADALS